MYGKGFTLLELLFVIIIIGILITVALPQYMAAIEKARSVEAVINVGAIRVALDRYWYQNGALPVDDNFATLDIDNSNAIANRLYTYSFKDNGTISSKRQYSVTATRINNVDTWIKWTQTDNMTGKLTRSENLGGPII
ncbi:MAG: prepilin-type N-terminal cleavage/methylation domain-containing protein [Candidatus Omnitrophica bacterium]|nr:prepilin-type N-terminal cleavage/methylation domain-containing protein [Candidatus Omnitrophota bacterium]